MTIRKDKDVSKLKDVCRATDKTTDKVRMEKVRHAELLITVPFELRGGLCLFTPLYPLEDPRGIQV